MEFLNNPLIWNRIIIALGLIFGMMVIAYLIIEKVLSTLPPENPLPPRPRKALKPYRREGNVIFLENAREGQKSDDFRKVS